MAKVELYPLVKGKRLNHYMATHPRVAAALRAHATQSRTRANILLGQHAHAGHSYVTAHKGSIDWYVTLNDPSGPDPAGKYPIWANALAIEYGRPFETTSPYGRSRGLFILHRAVGAGVAHRRRRGAKIRVRVPGGKRWFRFE